MKTGLRNFVFLSILGFKIEKKMIMFKDLKVIEKLKMTVKVMENWFEIQKIEL